MENRFGVVIFTSNKDLKVHIDSTVTEGKSNFCFKIRDLIILWGFMVTHFTIINAIGLNGFWVKW